MRCVYCGEREADVIIDDPNCDSTKKWNVCLNCEAVIREQQKMSVGYLLLDTCKKQGITTYGAEKIIREAREAIKQLEKDSGIPTICVMIKKESKND